MITELQGEEGHLDFPRFPGRNGELKEAVPTSSESCVSLPHSEA